MLNNTNKIDKKNKAVEAVEDAVAAEVFAADTGNDGRVTFAGNVGRKLLGVDDTGCAVVGLLLDGFKEDWDKGLLLLSLKVGVSDEKRDGYFVDGSKPTEICFVGLALGRPIDGFGTLVEFEGSEVGL